ncbi:MAG: hypothetical protein RL630_1001 [Verrucomicrobiota bacterium]|jgi:hypothetical protein
MSANQASFYRRHFIGICFQLKIKITDSMDKIQSEARKSGLAEADLEAILAKENPS